MAANLTTHIPIIPLQTVSGNTDFTISIPEKAGQTFLSGVPVQLSGGYVQIWDGATYNGGLLGVSAIPGSNLATNGAGAPGAFSQITGIGAIQSYGKVINQPGAVNIAVGTPITDGRTLVNASYSDTVFEAMVDNSTGAVAADYTPTQANVGLAYGLTLDGNGYAYVDLGKNTSGTNTCVIIVGLSPVDGSIVNGRVRFIFQRSAQQVYSA